MFPDPEVADIIVVGAGLSGLRAAVEVHEAGYSVIVLEARDRVGGKTLSHEASPIGGKVDLGAAWINDTNQSEIFALAKKFGFDLVEQRTTGLNVRHNGDGSISTMPYGEGELSGISRSYDVTKLYQAIMEYTPSMHPQQPHLSPKAAELDSVSFAEYAKKMCGTDEEIKEASSLTAALLGVSAEETSALYILDYIQSGTGFLNMISDGKDGGQYLRNRQGNQTFSIALAALLPPHCVRLSEPVSRILQKASEGCLVQVKSLGRAYRAKRVIVSVPTCTLETIVFDPPLPAAKQELAQSTALGYYAKTIFVFDRPWWHEADLSGVITSEEGPIAFSRDTCIPADTQYSITCFIVGETGRKWSKWSTKERRRLVEEQFDATLAATARSKGVKVPKAINVIEKEWIKDPWSFGAPSPVCGVGVLTSDGGKAMRLQAGNIHFVGTETSTVWKGYMEGAVRSGVRGAKEVINAFANTSSISAKMA